MRIATWNVNSLKARIEKVTWWLERIAPDVLLFQETKLSDTDASASRAVLERAGYELAHHGEGGRNGVAIASRVGIEDVIVNFGAPERVSGRTGKGDTEPLTEARMISAVTGGIRVVSIYVPNGRIVGSPFYEAKLGWLDHLEQWLRNARRPDEALVVGGDFNIAPDDRDVWDAQACHGGTHVSEPERERFRRLCDWGLVDVYRQQHDHAARYTWWDYRAGDFFKNFGMRIDHLLCTSSVAKRAVFVEIDREARKGKPTPSDHAPLLVDIDELGKPFDAGWAGAEERIAARRAKSRS